MSNTLSFKKPIKQGWLEKQSRHLKRWKRRWFILDGNYLYSFKTDKDYSNPTESIDLTVYSSVKSSEDRTLMKYSFDVYSKNHAFSLVASTDQEKEDWIRVIGKAIVLSRTSIHDDYDDEEDEEE